ncbi:hypothetical protein PEC301619_20430 [Pectobacterium carotovorum subsp. carotovorum]|nr:hypothetical protein PEC301619_20430 [Pectobacterium carotovorum subsp. carotovorum]
MHKGLKLVYVHDGLYISVLMRKSGVKEGCPCQKAGDIQCLMYE